MSDNKYKNKTPEELLADIFGGNEEKPQEFNNERTQEPSKPIREPKRPLDVNVPKNTKRPPEAPKRAPEPIYEEEAYEEPVYEDEYYGQEEFDAYDEYYEDDYYDDGYYNDDYYDDGYYDDYGYEDEAPAYNQGDVYYEELELPLIAIPGDYGEDAYFIDAHKYFPHTIAGKIYGKLPSGLKGVLDPLLNKWLDFRQEAYFKQPKYQDKADDIYYDFLEFNDLDAYGQAEVRGAEKQKAKKVAIGSLVAIVLTVFFVLIPTVNFNQGKRALQNGNHPKAYQKFKKSGSKGRTSGFLTLSEAKVMEDEHKYDEALTIIQSLEGKSKINTDELMKNNRYLKGQYLFEQENYKEAQKVFNNKDLLKYKKSLELYNQAGYKGAEKAFEEGDIVEAINLYGSVGSYNDAKQQVETLSSKIYNDAMALYKAKDYAAAGEEFKKISAVGYKNSRDMVNQGVYKEAISLLDNKKFDEAYAKFSEIPNYRDTVAFLKETNYRKANTIMSKSPAESAILLFDVLDFKNARAQLAKPEVALYGKFNIVEKNGKKIADEELNFNSNNTFTSKVSIDNIALSTEGNEIKYTYSGNGVYKASRGGYQIKVTGASVDYVKFEASNGKTKTSYKAQRVMHLGEMVDDSGARPVQNEQLLIRRIVNTYAQSKSSGLISFNGYKFEPKNASQFFEGRLECSSGICTEEIEVNQDE